ncbi:MAG: hypothetical protein M3M87_00400 [Thermoproteota archaeon]|nr:hypothetical protein [Thermoproteota archaeon]
MLIDRSTRSLSPTKALALVVVVGSLLISNVMIILGQAVGKGIESVMIIHDYYIALAIMSGAGFIGVLVFGSSQIGQQVQRYPDAINTLKVLALTAVASAFLIEITGTIGYIEYRLPDPDSAKSKILEIFPFAHEPMFEVMEYVGLVGVIWTGLIAYFTWHFRERMFADIGVRNAMIVMISLAIIYALVISLMGIVPTKIASVQG